MSKRIPGTSITPTSSARVVRPHVPPLNLDLGGATLSDTAERFVDNDQAFSLRDFLTGLFLRKWLFILCALTPAVLGAAMTVITPITWYATTKILIRYGSSESAFLKDLIPDDRVPISAGTSGEIIRSLPTLEEAVRRYDIQDADLYRSQFKVISSYVSDLVRPIFGFSKDEETTGADYKIRETAKTLQDSLQESSKAGLGAGGSRASPVAVLGKDSPLPQAMKGDELITLTVKGFNRLTVADIANGLAQTFIEQYYKISADDARRSSEFLSRLVDKSVTDIQLLEQNPEADAASSVSDLRLGSGDLASNRSSPAMRDLSNTLAELKSELVHLQQIYREDSPRIQRVKAEIESIKRSLAGQQRIDMAKQVLEQIKARRFQALNAESLYNNALVPIRIVEPAVTPTPSKSIHITRVLTTSLIGLLIGTALGLALVVLLGLLDQRLHTARDVERTLKLPIFGGLPRLRRTWRRPGELPSLGGRETRDAEGSLLRVVAHLDAMNTGGQDNVVTIVSNDDGDGKSLVTLLLAGALAGSGNGKVLLIDADAEHASLTKHFRKHDLPGLFDKATHEDLAASMIVPTGLSNVDLLPAGSEKERQRAGFYLLRLREVLNEVRDSHDLIIIDSPSAASGGGALICSMAADKTLLVVKSGSSHRGALVSFLRDLHEIAAAPVGVILNFQRNILPGFINRRA